MHNAALLLIIDTEKDMTAPAVLPKLENASNVTIAHRGCMEIRLVTTPDEIYAAQALRYRVFYQEMSATPDSDALKSKLDKDAFDDICEHLIVIDHSCTNADVGGQGSDPAVIGTYRLLRQDIAEKNGGFYTSGEFDIAPLVASKRKTHKFLELGRSCVLKTYRTKQILELLWHGIWRYVRLRNLDVMLGCASFAGIDPEEFALPLSFLHHKYSAPAEWAVKALPERYVNMNRIAEDQLDLRAAMRVMPPLIKGYLRLGAYIGEGAVIDEQFGTVDILIILPNSVISERYLARFGDPNEQIKLNAEV